MNLFSDKILQAVCWTLLHSLWEGLLLAAITGLVMVASKKSSSALRYNLLSSLFILFIAVVCFTFYKQLQLADQNTIAETGISTNHSSHVSSEILPVQKNFTQNISLRYYVMQFIDYFNTHASLIVTIWFIIFMAKCVKILSGLVHIQRIRHYKINDASKQWKEKVAELAQKLGIKKQILLLESAIIKVPVVVGIFKPAILVPLGLLTHLPPQEIESILIHELAHIRRKDYFFNLIQCFVDVLFFFNPAILWISALIRNERENCCDDIAIHQTKSKRQFVQALVSFHQYNDAAAKYAIPFSDKRNRLVNRVRRIVNNNNHTLNPVEKIVLVLGLFIFSVVFISISQGQTNPQKKQDQNKVSNPKNTITQKPVSKTSAPASAKKNISVQTNKPQAEKNKNNSDKQSLQQVAQLQTDDEGLPSTFKGLSGDQLIALREHGVTKDFIRAFNQLGYKDISFREAMTLKDHGVSPDYVEAFYNLGYKNIPLNQLQELKDHGVNADFINDLKQSGVKDISLGRAIELRDHGVNTDFISEFRKIGYKDISLSQAQQLRDHGVDADFISSFFALGYNNLSLGEALNLRDHTVDADFINDLKQLGFKTISPERAIDLRNHGVDANFINGFMKLGYTDISLDDAQKLRDFGVNANYINRIKETGLKNITLENIVELRNHGVTAEFIEKMRKRTGSDLSVDDYINLKEHL